MWNYSLKVNSPLLTSNLNLIEIDRQFRPRRVDMVFLQFGHSKAAQNQEEYSLHASYATIRGISLMFVCVCVVCVKCVGVDKMVLAELKQVGLCVYLCVSVFVYVCV